MLRADRIRRRTRQLCVATLGLQMVAVAAIAQSGHQSSATADEAAQTITVPQAATPAAEAALPGEAPETTLAPTTTAAPAAPPAPAPPPAPKAAPVPARAPAPAVAPAPPVDPAARVEAAYESSVPAAWREAITVRFELIDGNTSWAAHDGTIQIGSAHVNGSEGLLRATIAHEFGHLVAFQFGSQAFNGAAPEGWPAYSAHPEEAWADCASRVFSGVNDPSHGLPDCAGGSLSWTADWLASGPGGHPRTGS